MSDGVRRDGDLAGDQVVLVPVRPEHREDLERIRRTPEVERRWGRWIPAPHWPPEDDGAICYTILAGGTVRGLVQYTEENDPMYRRAAIDLFVDPAAHNRGIGRDAVRTLAGHLVCERGHHRLTIDPAADNVAAIRCYTAAGFRPVGIMRRYERDADGEGWHDGLLMDLLAEDLDPATAAGRGPAEAPVTAHRSQPAG